MENQPDKQQNFILNVPPNLLRGQPKDQAEYLRRGKMLWSLIKNKLSIDDFSQTRLLDVGCGTKMVRSLLHSNMAIGKYVGVDVHPPLIEFLNEQISDARFEFYLFDAQNEMYNPEGTPLTAGARLPTAELFDVICLFSVFTHLAPHDYENMLKVMRHNIKPEGQLLFSLYIDEPTDDGYGLTDGIIRGTGLQWHPPTTGFRDANPAPLKWAVYSREYAEELVRKCGWKITGNYPPAEVIQHHFVCEPA